MKIRDLLLFNPETFQNLYLVHNLVKTNFSEDNIYGEKIDSGVNRRTNYNNNNKDNYRESEKVNYINNQIQDLNNKYETNINYGNYSRSNLNENRPISSQSENPNDNNKNLIYNRKENERFRDYENSENKLPNPPHINYLKDSKEDDLLTSTINTKNDFGNYQQQHQENLDGNQQRFNNSESENIARGDYDIYRFINRDRKEFIDISSDNNTIGNTRERFNCIIYFFLERIIFLSQFIFFYLY